jgi:hypothetical protein
MTHFVLTRYGRIRQGSDVWFGKCPQPTVNVTNLNKGGKDGLGHLPAAGAAVNAANELRPPF